jgi:hypothetical protein
MKVAYKLSIIGGELSDHELTKLDQIKKLGQIAQDHGGDAAGPWEYHFPTFDHATTAAHEIRQMGLTLDSIEIRPVDGDTGKAPPS